MVELADDYLSIADFDVYYAVNCLDWEWPEDPQELLDAEAPHPSRPTSARRSSTST